MKGASTDVAGGGSTIGLTSDEARRRLASCGPNAMPDTGAHPLRMALEKFWAPVPWMLEAAIVLELVLGKYVEAAVIALLLVFNAGLGLFQESRAQATLAALKSRLALTASVSRDGVWTTVPAADLVPGDMVKLSLGGVVAADVNLTGRRGSPRPVHAHRRIRADRSGCRVLRPLRARWSGAAKPRRRSRRLGRAPSSAAPPNWFARPMSSVRNRRRCCGSCAISRASTASSSCCWRPTPGVSACRSRRSYRLC